MLVYVLVGAAIGIAVGYIIPPGGILWFVVGGISGFLAKHYINRRL